MKTLLFVTSSLSGEDSRSERVARELITALGQARISERRLGHGSIPHLTGEYLQAAMTAPGKRTPREHGSPNAARPISKISKPRM